MRQISEYIFISDILNDIEIPNKFLPNPYYDFPFLIIENYLTTAQTNLITKETKASLDFKEAKLRDAKLREKTNIQTRKTNIYKLSSICESIYKEAFIQHKQKIEDFFAKVIIYSTDTQVLGYKKGFFYKSHSDDSSFLVDKKGGLAGFKLVAKNRKITTVCFANDDFIGGELEFNFLKQADGSAVVYKPKTGSLLAFPSNSIFTHEVKEVKAGFRISLVQWHDAI